MSRGTGEKNVGLCNRLKEYGTPYHPFVHPLTKPLMGIVRAQAKSANDAKLG